MQIKFFGIFAAMESLTQIILGAACGEIAMGKKIGNKAMLFGAIGGTIPDLDVFIGHIFYGNSIEIMTFHRGFMHSLIFPFIASFLLGWLVFKLYNSRRRIGSTTLKDWNWLFFLSIITHPILDCFTPYGTQLFSPFSEYRVAFNTISVADPAYTLPFLFCMIFALFLKRNNPKRIKWVKTGILISSLYLLFTVVNKFHINTVFKSSFEKAEIPYQRFRTQPTILNNVLWYGIAETATDYKLAFYSLFDESNFADTFITVPKNTTLLNIDNPDLQRLAWFSDQYYLIEKKENPTRIIYNDMRYVMTLPNDSIKAMINFEIYKNGNRLEMKRNLDFDPPKNFIKNFWERIKGK